MKKQELIHLHSLLAQVQNHYEHEADTSVEHDLYADLGVPGAMTEQKLSHSTSQQSEQGAAWVAAENYLTVVVNQDAVQW